MCSRHMHYSGFGAGFSETKTTFGTTVDLKHNMANPTGHVVWGEEEAQQAAECYATMKAEL